MKPEVNVIVGGAKKPTNYTYKTVILKSNLPFAAQIGDPNCIYIVRWDFDLGGETVTIPENCVLKFEGGSIASGSIVLSGIGITLSGNTKFLAGNDLVKYDKNNAELYLEHDITVNMGKDGASDNIRRVYIKSNRKAVITPIVYSSVVPHFVNCNILKTSGAVYFTLNKGYTTIEKSVFENCVFTASEDFQDRTDAKCLVIVGAKADSENERDFIPTQIAGFYNCHFDNVGIACTGEVVNCTFNIGPNNLYNNEPIHGGGLIQNCSFYSSREFVYDYGMQDIIDTFQTFCTNIKDCYFDKTIICSNVITIKQHYGRSSDPQDGKPAIDTDGVSVTGCVFNQGRGQSIKVFTQTNEENPDIDNDYNIKNIIISKNRFSPNYNTCIEIFNAHNVIISENYVKLEEGVTNFNTCFVSITNSKNISVNGNIQEYRGDNNIHNYTSYKHVRILLPQGTTCYPKNISVINNVVYGIICEGLNVCRENLVIKDNISNGAYNLWGTENYIDLYSNEAYKETSYCIENNSYYDLSLSRMINSDFYDVSESEKMKPLYIGAKRYNFLFGAMTMFIGSRWVKINGVPLDSIQGAPAYRPKGAGAEGGTLISPYDRGYSYFDVSLNKPIFAKTIDNDNGDVEWIDADGIGSDISRRGSVAQRPTDASLPNGFEFMQYDQIRGKFPIWVTKEDGTIVWVKADGTVADTPLSGTFAAKPTVSANRIPVGFGYFCTDKQTAEGTTDGIMIFHKGSDAWVDALGRIVE